MTGNSKVLTGLMERRALEAAFTALSEATSAAELARQADEIAVHPRAALPVLVARLDTEDPQLRGGLGEVAKRLDREAVVSALQGVLRSRERSQIARLSAATILARYLGEPVDESQLIGIGDPETLAIRSLNELIAAMDGDEAAILEYLEQLAAQPPETPGLILAAVPRLPPHRHLVTLLRVFAQDADARRAQNAIEQLGRLRMPEALLALEGLTLALPLSLGRLAERNARKLRMTGVRADEVEAPHWRTLISPVDGAGAQVIWFIRPDGDQTSETQLTFIVRDPDGIVAFFGAHQAAGDGLPAEKPIGSVSALPQADGAPALQLLEAPFDAGRHAVRAALARHWEAGTAPPLAYRFWNAPLWNAGALTEEAPPQASEYRSLEMAALLDHPAFAGWFWRDEAAVEAARRLGAHPSAGGRASMIAVLAALHFGPEVTASYRRRLGNMARWLALSGQPEAAGLAAGLSVHLTMTPPAESPFVRRLIGIGLDIAALSNATEQT